MDNLCSVDSDEKFSEDTEEESNLKSEIAKEKVTQIQKVKKLNLRQKAVDRRAWLLMSEYRRKARNVDKGVIGVGDRIVGPIEIKLAKYGDLLGLVVCAWGDGSKPKTCTPLSRYSLSPGWTQWAGPGAGPPQ